MKRSQTLPSPPSNGNFRSPAWTRDHPIIDTAPTLPTSSSHQLLHDEQLIPLTWSPIPSSPLDESLEWFQILQNPPPSPMNVLPPSWTRDHRITLPNTIDNAQSPLPAPSNRLPPILPSGGTPYVSQIVNGVLSLSFLFRRDFNATSVTR